jgi:hypothetical protein
MAGRDLPGLGLSALIGFWGTGFNGWGAEMDANLRLLSVLLNAKVLDRVAAVPGSPSEGDIYLLTANPNIDTIAVRDDGAWVYYTPIEGFVVWVADEDQHYIYTGTAWAPLSLFPRFSFNAGTFTGGTYTPDPANGKLQFTINGGAHTLAPPTAIGDYEMAIQYTNNASAGAITTSGFTKVNGSFTTTNGDDFLARITKLNGFTLLEIIPLQ